MYAQKISQFCSVGRENWNDHIRMLLYKEDEFIFDKIDYYDENIYKDPLFFAFFNSKVRNNEEILNSILYNSFYERQNVKFGFDEYNTIYVSNVGWILGNENKTKKIEFTFLKDSEFKFENAHIIENTNVELLKYPIGLLEQCYPSNEVEIEEISKKHVLNLTKAYQLIEKCAPSHFNLINEFSTKCVIFNTNPINTNSFAHKSALGIAFYNAYQENYDEVFFVDDIAHQTGHVLMYTILYDKKKFFLVDDEKLEIQDFSNGIKNKKDKRNIEIWFHALYTYYTSFICLDACLDNKIFNKNQEYEALGRILMYIYKCHYDLSILSSPIEGTKLFDKIDNSKIFKDDLSNTIFTDMGLIIFTEIKNKWNEIFQKYYPKLKELDLKNQSYNFDFKLFLKVNPILER